MAGRRIFYLFLVEFLLVGSSFNIFGPLIPVIARYYDINLVTVGFNLSLHAVALLLASIILGRVNQYFSSRNIILAGILLEIIAFVGIFFSGNFYLFIAFYFLFGTGMASVLISVSSLTCDIMPAQKSRNLTILNIALGSGVFIGPLLVSGFLRLGLHWQYLFLMLGLLKIPVLIMFNLIRGSKVHVREKTAAALKESFKIFRNLFRNGFIILIIIIVFLNQGFLSSFMSWFTAYFEQYDVGVASSSIFLSLYNISLVAGLIMKVFLLKKADEKMMMLVGYSTGFLSLLGFYFADILAAKVAFSIVFGLSVPGFFMFSLSLAVGRLKDNTGTVSSVVFTFGYLGMVFYQFLSGYISENYSPDLLFVIITGTAFILVIINMILSLGPAGKPDTGPGS